MPKQISPKIVALTFGILAISFLAAFYVIAWQEPAQAPPGGNVSAPLNTGSTGQSKAGGLILNTGGAQNALIIDKGNLCFGSSDCRSSWPAGADLKNIQVTPIDWDAIRICQAGTCCPPWRDCDGDGKTYMARNDCNEGCATCYVGSPTYTITPPGDFKDQDCDGVIDESDLTGPTTMTCNGWPHCQLTYASECASACASICSQAGGHTPTVTTCYNLGTGDVCMPGRCGAYGYTWWAGEASGPACLPQALMNCACYFGGYH